MLAATLSIVQLWAEPPVHDLSYAARAAVHTGKSTVVADAGQFLAPPQDVPVQVPSVCAAFLL